LTNFDLRDGPNPPREIYILGATDPSLIRLFKDIRFEAKNQVAISGLIDRDWKNLPDKFHGVPVLGPESAVKHLDPDKVVIVNSIASNMMERRKISETWQRKGFRFINLVHPSVNLEMVSIGTGNLLLECRVGPDVVIGNQNVLRAGSQIGHGTKIEDYCFFGPGSTLCGNVSVGSGSFVGAGSTVLPGISIGAGAIVGAGALVVKDVKAGSTVMGAPAQERKFNSHDE